MLVGTLAFASWRIAKVLSDLIIFGSGILVGIPLGVGLILFCGIESGD